MYKIRKITFQDNPVLGNLSMDFCGADGKAVDTVIIAGENGMGKSTVLNELFKIASHAVSTPLMVEFQEGERIFTITYSLRERENREPMVYANDDQGMNVWIKSEDIKNRYKFNGIFSDVDINFHAQEVSTVTSLTLDSETKSRRSSTDLPTQIKQLIIDIQSLDDSEVARAVRSNPDIPSRNLHISERMPRFTNAFNRMFDGLTYNRVENSNGHKAILFQKNAIEIPIDALSSGEKQIVYRGCFLLKDINALSGAFVFIDEPEISLHPSWQKKIMDYYKGIFSNEDGTQTSQIFAVTHSPFIIHNENRKNDKVIVLARDEIGNIIVKDHPEYYRCDSVEAVEDAFSIYGFSEETPTVYLEGQTDEKYFNKTIEVFEMDVPFQFKWVGYIDDRGQEANTGDKSVDKAFHFLAAHNLPYKNICLKDSDTNRNVTRFRNVIATSIRKYESAKGMEKGIENALVLDSIELSPYYIEKEKVGNYGEKTIYQEFDKMACCDAICAMDIETLRGVFTHLKDTVDELIRLYNEVVE
jgi:ABC-type Mn2+/Zn2+ transport system ATPase subunit